MADSPRSLVRVVVPVYRELTPDEESSLRNNVRVLAALIFVCGDFTHAARELVMREELFRLLSMGNVVPKLWLCKLNNRRLSIVLFKTNI